MFAKPSKNDFENTRNAGLCLLMQTYHSLETARLKKSKMLIKTLTEK